MMAKIILLVNLLLNRIDKSFFVAGLKMVLSEVPIVPNLIKHIPQCNNQLLGQSMYRAIRVDALEIRSLHLHP